LRFWGLRVEGFGGWGVAPVAEIRVLSHIHPCALVALEGPVDERHLDKPGRDHQHVQQVDVVLRCGVRESVGWIGCRLAG